MRHNERGMGLMEVLVALLILAIAILGFSALQLQSVKATSESVDRSQTLLLMRSFAERVRANPSAIADYKTAFNSFEAGTLTEPTKLCQPTTNSNGLCTASELATADVWRLTRQLNATGLTMDLQPCPSTGGAGTNAATNVMYSYCLITAWGQTNPTIGSDTDPSDGSMDCLTPRDATDANAIKSGGTYHPKATCMFMEVN
ncbi:MULTISPECIES: type IV pilus modification protein PilV [unclassified Moraxella]|uniref:type IV pilus modification protein PilV n=1 Tax=unclassified Moraxella TaxID=2685852 RepID=UPI003AF6F606